MSFTVAVTQPATANFGPQLSELIKIILQVNGYKGEKEITFDLKNITFVHPVFILSMVAYMDYLTEKGYAVVFSNVRIDSIGAYLKTIYFPEGLKPDNFINWEGALDNYSRKNYLPILNFPASQKSKETEIRENVLTKVSNLLKKNLQLNASYMDGITYLISEITDNVVDHSGAERCWLAAQYYPSKEYLDSCIIDTGKTILGSYLERGYKQVSNDQQAIESAISGLSTKDKERGHGIPTSHAMIVNGLRGKFGLISGEAALFNNKLVQFPVKWNGTILTLRIPKGVTNFNYIHFV